jgi:CRISPR-associated protein Cmr2
MDEIAFWQQKLIQFLHDPPAKPYSSYPDRGGHRTIAAGLLERFSKLGMKYLSPAPDWAASGADQPVLTLPRDLPGRVQVYWPRQAYITHPLAAGYLLDVRHLHEAEPESEAEARKELRDALLKDQTEVAAGLGWALVDWRNLLQLRTSFFRLWRRFRDELLARHAEYGSLAGDPLWEEMPADSRCPDHSIWDHLKISTALAFLKPHTSKTEAWVQNDWEEGARQPWLLRFNLGPAQRFIAESRTSRDLWISSYLLADLVWHAMEPLVERYGPDCIIYPDLRGNPRVDVWLYRHYRDALPDAANPSILAAVLPNTFTALVPLGGDGYLLPIEKLAEEAQQAVQKRWKALADTVRDWLRGVVRGNKEWEKIWERQQQGVIYTTWSAIPWLPPGSIVDKENLRGRALPAQIPGFRNPLPERLAQAEKDRRIIDNRRARLAPWVPKAIWHRYEWAREVYTFSYLDYLQMERGFDYALTYHQLGVRHALRKATAPDFLAGEEPGEQCTVCGHRQALTEDAVNPEGGLDHSRAASRRFWSAEKLDPDRSGQERLCAVCTLKRFLVAADQNWSGSVFNRLWAGPATFFFQVKDDWEVRVPFPSTATLAAQEYLAGLVKEAGLEPYLAEMTQACRQAGLPRTSSPRALPRLAEAYRRASICGKELLEYEAQDVLFPEVIDSKIQVLSKTAANEKVAQWNELRQAVKRLRRETDQRLGRGPKTQIAVIKLDGDNMARLLLGEEDCIGARWRDVIHPQALEQIGKSQHLLEAGWADLLDAKRLMGPSLHAFISRALANFSHCIVPWVVEREFSGRLVYAGGDEVLCLAPAGEALALAARLQQLFSAAWIIDTNYHTDPWAWRRNDWWGEYNQDHARRRFAIPRMPASVSEDVPAIHLPVEDSELLETHAAEEEGWLLLSGQGPLLPMLGPWVSLSAGIVFAHYKTPLSVLLHQTERLLEWAKEPFRGCDLGCKPHGEGEWQGRRAVALSYYSRSGIKTEFTLPWSIPGQPPEAHKTIKRVIDGFNEGQLPACLPYKLRELAFSASYALERIRQHQPPDDNARRRNESWLLRGLFNHCLDRSGSLATQAAFELWQAGINLHSAEPERYTDGLLLCLALARGGTDEEEGRV